MIQEIKELRVKIDGLYNLTRDLKPYSMYGIKAIVKMDVPSFNSWEIEDAAKSLLLAKAWLGKLLGELGSENPYSSGKKEVKDIEPTADTHWQKDWDNLYDVDGCKVVNLSHIQKVDWLRSEIQSVIDEVQLITDDVTHRVDRSNYRRALCVQNTYKHLCEAKMWLGFEFARIKEENL